MCIHIDRPEAPEAAEWFELAARAVQMGNEKIARWRLWSKKCSKFGENCSVWDEKRPVRAQRRGESTGPPFRGWKRIKIAKNYEKSTAKHRKTKLTSIEQNIVFYRERFEIESELIRLGSNKIAWRSGRRGENFASARRWRIEGFRAIFRDNLPEKIVKMIHRLYLAYTAYIIYGSL